MTAQYPVWRDSTSAPIVTRPISKADLQHYRREALAFAKSLDRSPRCSAPMATTLRVYEALISFMNPSSGQCDPSYSSLADRARVSVSTVYRELRRLRSLGMVDWVRRYREVIRDGRVERHQTSNLYTLCAPSLWRGWKAQAPCPVPEYGRAPIVLTGREEAVERIHRKEPPAEVLKALSIDDDPLAKALARFQRSIIDRSIGHSA